jgi:hypothetical protein
LALQSFLISLIYIHHQLVSFKSNNASPTLVRQLNRVIFARLNSSHGQMAVWQAAEPQSAISWHILHQGPDDLAVYSAAPNLAKSKVYAQDGINALFNRVITLHWEMNTLEYSK